MFEVCDLNADMIVDQEGLESEWKDNRHLLDDHGLSQKLSMEDIEVLKQSASSNREIIDNLVKNSATFETKSVFSQAKYIKKKKQKYTNYYRLLKPTVKLLADMYFIQGPSKQTNLRLDTLAQMLTAVNVRSGGKYLVVDNYLGLLTSAVIDRLVGMNPTEIPVEKMGTVIQTYLEPGPVASWRSCVHALNLPNEVLESVLLSCQIHQAYKAAKDSKKSGQSKEEREGVNEADIPEEDGNEAETIPVDEEIDEMEEEQDQSCQLEEEDNDNEASTSKRKDFSSINSTLDIDDLIAVKKRKLDERAKRKSLRKIEEGKAVKILSTQSLDGFLVISRNIDPSSFVDVLLDLLSPSASFAIYNHVSEPLAECMANMKNRAVNLRLSETWLRKYQVLPGRTRPDMNMSTTGGYLLTGVKVVD